jgi:hypothetical protein
MSFSLTARALSRLSDASKLLRRIEKNMHSHQRIDGHSGRSASVSESPAETSGSRLPETTASSASSYTSGSHGQWTSAVPSSDDLPAPSDISVQPPDARRHSFFSTILNPPQSSLPPSTPPHGHTDEDMVVTDVPTGSPSSLRARDPVEAGLMSSHMANVLVEQFIIRLNPFIVVRISISCVPVDRH